ncbi:MAG TPA: ATP-dependent 6-phosphofructokinase [Candidatus Atribacteria bacterium]|nr:ATP-dependent 6-phosphofructokinase [Candidatus Atribacteria bacterium]
MIKRVGILTGGGDCPGLNPTIRGAVYRAQDYDYEVYGIQEGWKGLVKGNINPLSLSEVKEIVDRGGTILGTSRTNPYNLENGVEQVLNSIKKFKLDAIIAIGGEDTLGVANRLFKEENVKLVGAPKTMDNDLNGTDYTFGFDSSVTWAIEAMRSLQDSGRSHRRIMVLEVMGRHAGWVALFTGMASGADWTLIPEEKADVKKMCQHLQEVYKKNKYASVVISEGVTLPGIDVEKESLDQFGHMILRNRGVGNFLADLIKKNTGIETRHAVIGHIQRGGSPTLFDRILGLRCGVTAVDLVAQGKFGYMAALRGSEAIGVPLEKAVSKLKVVDKKWRELAQVFFK